MKIFMASLVILVLACTIHSSVQAQISLNGTVRDAASGEELVGVNVLVVGTSLGTTTNLDGRYDLRNVPEAPFDVRFSFVGYAPSTVTQVRVKPGEALKLDVNLNSEAVTTEEVTVTADRQLNTESAVLAQRKKSATIGDVVSLEQVKKSPDVTSGDALKRVTGVTIADNKFIFVRGVTDRYNAATLNGVSVTSTDTDTDKKSFAFDLIPANLLENMTVTKTATPDLPGDFTGGLVQLNTLDFPTTRTMKLGISTSSNSITTSNTILRSEGGGSDWIGFDDGTRAFPSDKDVTYDLPKSLPNNWQQQGKRAPLNGSFNLSAGDRFPVGEESQVGYIAGLTYRNSFQRTETTSDYVRFGSTIIDADGVRDVRNILWGGLLNLSYQVSPLHKITLNNNFNQNAEDKLTNNDFLDENEELNIARLTEWDQRTNYVLQLAGSHNFPAQANLDVQWRGAYSSSIAEEPDRKESVFAKPLRAPAGFPYQFESARRSWSNLREFTRSFGLDFGLPIAAETKLKFGGFIEGKSRTFDIRFFQVDSRNVQDGTLLSQPIDSIFAADNFATDKFFMLENSTPRDVYSGTHDLYAAYLSIDQRFTLLSQSFRFVGGARMENSEQLVNTLSPFATNEPFVARVKNIDVLPSANLTYLINDLTNLRLAYSQSVNRPEFRELSAFYFYDFNTFEGTFGNPLLERALSRNYDARIEVFPGIGEVIAVSYFYKNISNAIEVRVIPSTNPERTWFNSPNGTNEGLELELRKTLGFFGDYFENVVVGVNYTRVFSAIEYQEGYKIDSAGVFVDRFRTATREMQGQSPYSINLSLGFTEPTIGTSISFLFNEFGERIDAIGDERQFDILEQPRAVIDLSITQPITRGIECKFAIRDIIAKKREFRTREGLPYKTSFQGRSYGFQISIAL